MSALALHDTEADGKKKANSAPAPRLNERLVSLFGNDDLNDRFMGPRRRNAAGQLSPSFGCS